MRILWACPGCGRTFANTNQVHTCVSMSFAAFMPRRNWLNGHLVLARRIDSPRFSRIDAYSPRNVVHAFKLVTPDDVDAEFVGWLGEAYRVGAQEHLTS